VLVTIHSYTPVYRGVARPWHAGIITTPDRRFADAVLAGLRRDAALVVGDNQPYSAKDNVDYTIRRHGFERGLANVMIEVGNAPSAGCRRCRMGGTGDRGPARSRGGDRH
jgi:predicted N-formylglutamate amidohydrolase